MTRTWCKYDGMMMAILFFGHTRLQRYLSLEPRKHASDARAKNCHRAENCLQKEEGRALSQSATVWQGRLHVQEVKPFAIAQPE